MGNKHLITRGGGAVMAERVEPHESLDFFPTPLWATRALSSYLKTRHMISEQTAWDPGCGEGHMVRALHEDFQDVHASDIHDYGKAYPVRDFMGLIKIRPVDWIITNPPFKLGSEFAAEAIKNTDIGVAMLVRLQFLESKGRYEDLFQHRPPTVLIFAERVNIFRDVVSNEGNRPIAYCWLVWDHEEKQCSEGRIRWIAPCREFLTREGDYD